MRERSLCIGYQYTVLTCLLFFSLFISSKVLAEKTGDPAALPAVKKLTLVEAVMCEEIEGPSPRNQAIVFSMALGKVICITSFDPVPEGTCVYHKWFRRDKLVTKTKLSLRPPRWSAFSSIHLREVDRGPWRVEITDQQGNLFQTLRFSITD